MLKTTRFALPLLTLVLLAAPCCGPTVDAETEPAPVCALLLPPGECDLTYHALVTSCQYTAGEAYDFPALAGEGGNGESDACECVPWPFSLSCEGRQYRVLCCDVGGAL